MIYLAIFVNLVSILLNTYVFIKLNNRLYLFSAFISFFMILLSLKLLSLDSFS